MKEVSSGQGRTVLFVSHNMTSVQTLCQRGILLDQGKVLFDGPATTCIEQYVSLNNQMSGAKSLAERTDREGDGLVRFTSVEVLADHSKDSTSLEAGAPVTIRLHYEVKKGETIDDYDLCVNIYDKLGDFLGYLTTMTACNPPLPVLKGAGFVDIKIPKLPLSERVYKIDLYIASKGKIHDYVKGAHNLIVSGGSFYGTNRNSRPYWYGRHVLIDYQFVFPSHERI